MSALRLIDQFSKLSTIDKRPVHTSTDHRLNTLFLLSFFLKGLKVKGRDRASEKNSPKALFFVSAEDLVHFPYPLKLSQNFSFFFFFFCLLTTQQMSITF